VSYAVYAIKGDPNCCDMVASLKAGEGRFGFSSVPTGDLRALKARVEKDGWPSLSAEEQASYYVFLLDLKKDDYVVYVDVPEWGRCVLARVTGDYYWRFDDSDHNHRFPVDPQSVHVFDRNSRSVHPSLSSRLRTQRVWWRVSLKAEFEELLANLNGSVPVDLPPEARLAREIQPILLRITQTIHHTYAGKNLEELCAEVFGHLPGVTRVDARNASGDAGADLLVRFESGLPLPGIERDDTLIVQVKVDKRENWDTEAVEDMGRALTRYPEASMGLLISTAAASTPALDTSLEKLRRESGKHVALLIGEDIAAFFLQYGDGLLTQDE
jgi:hypothetical protein